jgi:signal transduction histidine kinase/ActR/RegA family two-component response regulator
MPTPLVNPTTAQPHPAHSQGSAGAAALIGAAVLFVLAAAAALAATTDRLILLGLLAFLPLACLVGAFGVMAVLRSRRQIAEARAALGYAQQAARIAVWTWEADTADDRIRWDAERHLLFGGAPPPTLAAFGARLHPSDQSRFSRYADAVRKGAADAPAPFRLPALGSEGGWRHVSVRAEAERDSRGDVRRVRGTVQDVSDTVQREALLRRSRAEALEAKEAAERAAERAEEMNTLKNAFLANISHEIRTPLTGVLGFAQLLAEEVPSDLLRLVRPIEQGGRRLMDTVDAVLDLARLETGQVDVDLAAIDLAATARDAASRYRTAAADRGLALSVVVPGAPVYVLADRGALERALGHVVDNAVKFTEAGSVTLTIGEADGRGTVEVRDTGAGIDAAFLPRLFEAFTQESQGTARRFEGAGLGLPIAHQLLGLMDGTIAADSTPGAGSAFTLSVPLAEASPSLAVSAPKPAAVPALMGRRPRVLVVEDHPDAREVVVRVLRDQAEIEEAGTAEEAETALRTGRHDVVLMDVNLKGDRNGVDLMHLLRRLPHGPITPIAALTAYALHGDSERLLDAGFDAYLSKPFDRQDLVALVAQLVQLAEVQRKEAEAAA